MIAAGSERGVRIPRATYRVQLNHAFTFNDAREIVPYLAELGISHLYASPFLKARAGSTHGYDVVDHDALNPEIGTAAELDALVEALHAHSMGLMLDLVPNHMGVLKADNGWWLDVLEHGQASRYAGFFDIDWTPQGGERLGKVLVPILGDQYGRVLERGELSLQFDAPAGALSLWYFDHRLPVRPGDYPAFLMPESGGPADDPVAAALLEIAQCFSDRADRDDSSCISNANHDPSGANRDACEANSNASDTTPDASEANAAAKAALGALCTRMPEAGRRIASRVAACNGTPGNPASFDALHALIGRQAYRLAFWRVAADDINYRRFFDINDLAALRAECPEVFDATHRIALGLVGAGKADALRIDHPDGLSDPARYFERLQAAVATVLGERASVDGRGRAIYLVIEKILATHERLPQTWPVHGTTGYSFMNLVNRLFVDPANRTRFDRLYATFSREHASFTRVVRDSKTLIMTHAMRSELSRLAAALTRIAKADRNTCDFTRDGIRNALLEIVASFPVYRTYVTCNGASTDDLRHIDWAVAVAKRRSTVADTSVFDFVAATLRQPGGGPDTPHARDLREFIARFQQFSAPIMAKGVEDTAFYVYNRLASLNEVGGDPLVFGASIASFHGVSLLRARNWPHAMLATSTHDSKRGEDARTRIDALSEMPAAWRLALRRWRQMNRRHHRDVAGQPAPSANDEYLLYQTLLGTWPMAPATPASLALYRERIDAYMLKAVREAKVHTSWLNPDAAYESALAHFIGRLFDGPHAQRFVESLSPLAREVARIGCANSLAQTLVKLTSPGVPDTYQGAEMWDLSLVDPDNRRPVDYALRTQTVRDFAARGIDAPPPDDLLVNWTDGRVKLWLTWRLLQLRRQRPAFFADAGYMPVATGGAFASSACVYARRQDSRLLLCVVPRCWSALSRERPVWPLGKEFWRDTYAVLPADARRWRNVLTGGHIEVQPAAAALPSRLLLGDALAGFPVGVFDLR